MNILFLHRNFPAQFRHLLYYLPKDKKNKIAFITNKQNAYLDKILICIYKLSRRPNPDIHPYLRDYEEAILHAQGAARAALKLKKNGFIPDIIFAHAWGPPCFMKDIFPNVPLLGHFEWFYRSHGADADFALKAPMPIDRKARIRIKNSHLLTALYSCDAGIVPTKWQFQQIPQEFQQKLSIIHEGVDTKFFKPNPRANGLHINAINLHIPANTEIVTYATRGLEEYRGFPQFMEAVAILLKRRPNCHFVIGGDDLVHYGRKLPRGQNFRELMVKKLKIDLTRVHFIGTLPYPDYRKILQSSSVHVYLTYPFVLSWSILEAMACECLLVASNTPPVLEVVKDNINGLLFDFFAPNQLADRIEYCLNNRSNLQHIRTSARKTIIENYELQDCLRKQLELINTLKD